MLDTLTRHWSRRELFRRSALLTLPAIFRGRPAAAEMSRRGVTRVIADTRRAAARMSSRVRRVSGFMKTGRGVVSGCVSLPMDA